MSHHLIKLRRAKKKFNGFGTEKATLNQVIALLNETFIADDIYGEEKLNAFTELLTAAKGLVASRNELLKEKQHSDLDEEDYEIIYANEKELDHELFLFCEIFNSICATAGVVEYFANDNGELIWTEVSNYFNTTEKTGA